MLGFLFLGYTEIVLYAIFIASYSHLQLRGRTLQKENLKTLVLTVRIAGGFFPLHAGTTLVPREHRVHSAHKSMLRLGVTATDACCTRPAVLQRVSGGQ